MGGYWVVEGNVTAHFEVVVVVHVGLEERDSCSLVVGSPGMVVVVVGTLGMLMVEEGMLFIDISYIEVIPDLSTENFVLCLKIGRLTYLRILEVLITQFGQSMKPSATEE